MISKEIAQRIWQIQLKTKKILSGTMVGDRSTANKGVGFEFDQVREYVQGDDVRFIDWKSTARAGKVLTKQYFEERNHNIVIALDVSASSFVGSGEHSKYHVMSELAAVFALVAEYSKDNVGLVLFSDQINLQLPIACEKGHTFRLMETVLGFQSENKVFKTDVNLVLNHLIANLKQKSLVLLISDFIDQQDHHQALKRLQYRHDVVAVRCLDRYEHRLPPVGIMPIIDPETGMVAMVDTRKNTRLNRAIRERIVQQDLSLRGSGIDILQINDWSQSVSEVVKFFRKRLMY